MTERVIRRRNVTTRDRTGCVTCRARRLKCDEGKPHCKNCLRLQLPCGGYQPRIVFMDQTDMMRRKHQEKSSSSCPPAPTTPRSGGMPEVAAPEVALVDPSNRPTTDTSVLDTSPGRSSTIGVADSPGVADCDDLVVYEAASSLTAISSASLTKPAAAATEEARGEAKEAGAGPRVVDLDLQEFISDGLEVHHQFQPAQADSTMGNVFPDFEEVPPHSDPDSYIGQSTPCSTGEGSSLTVSPIAPLGLYEAAKFPQDMFYYHHLRDTSPNGLLSIIFLNDIFKAEFLDRGFFSAALALSALSVSQSHVSKPIAETAALQGLDHFVSALGTVRLADLDGQTPSSTVSTPAQAPVSPYKVACRLAIILFLALFDLQRGQMKSWSVHSRAAIMFLCDHIDQVRVSVVGESLIRSFARLVVLLEIYDRTFSARVFPSPSGIVASLVESLAASPFPSDRLLVIVPRVIELEEDWRSNPTDEVHWQERASRLRHELLEWRNSLTPGELPTPHFDESGHEQPVGGDEDIPSNPVRFPNSFNPIRSATNFMHYLVSLLRVQTHYSGGSRVLPHRAENIVILVCQIAAGMVVHGGVDIHAYGHGILPALMNAYYLSENEHVKKWIKRWLLSYPREREGIWNVRHAQRLIAYVDEEYGRRGPRSGWNIIKVRFVDLDEDVVPHDSSESDSHTLSVEIYARSKRGWSIDFVEVP